MQIPVPKEFNFNENFKYLTRSTNECLFQIKDQRIYKAIPLVDSIIEISMEDEYQLTINFLNNHPDKNTCATIAGYVREWFDLDTNITPFYDMAKKDPLLSCAVDSFYGLRIMGIPDLFEALCWGILGQQINLPFAYTLKRRLVENFGRSIDWGGEKYWIFPTPSDIAGLKVADFDGLQMTVKKCEYLIGVATLMAQGKLSKEMLTATGDIKKAEKMLVSIRGIGPWTANYVLMRCLRFPSAFPIDDVGLHNAIKHLMGRETKPSKDEILKLSARWAGWEAYATFYLWRFPY